MEALRWYRKAAEQSYILAQIKLGSLYARGQWVEEDPAVVAKWYRKAAEQGDTQSNTNWG